MAEEKKEKIDSKVKDGEQTPEEGSAKKKSKLPLMMIIVSVAAFAICIGVFSFTMGLFSSAPADSQDESGDETAEVADSTGHAKSSASKKDHELSDIEAMEAELFAREGLDNVEDMDDLMKMVEDRDKISEKDSLKAQAWIDTEKAKLKVERKELDSRQKELDRQEYRLTQIMEKVNQMTAARVGSLAKLYDGMKAQQVAPLLNKLTDEQSVMVLLKMKPANAAKLLGALSPDRAARISAKMITLAEEN